MILWELKQVDVEALLSDVTFIVNLIRCLSDGLQIPVTRPKNLACSFATQRELPRGLVKKQNSGVLNETKHQHYTSELYEGNVRWSNERNLAFLKGRLLSE